MAQQAKQPRIKIELTQEQQEQIKQATGLTVPALDLTPEALEERVAPGGVPVEAIKL